MLGPGPWARIGRFMELKPLVTLLAIVNPLAIVPFFIHYTQNFRPRSGATPFRCPRSAPLW